MIKINIKSVKILLTEAYIDDKKVGNVKRQHNYLCKQHDVQLQFPVKITRTANKTNTINIIMDEKKLISPPENWIEISTSGKWRYQIRLIPR